MCDDFRHMIWINNLERVIDSHSLHIAAQKGGWLKGKNNEGVHFLSMRDIPMMMAVTCRKRNL